MSTAAHLHPWKPLPHGPTPICDALMADWLTTHRQHYPGEPPVGRVVSCSWLSGSPW